VSHEITVRRKAPVEQVDAQLAPMMLLRDTLSVIGPRIIREHSSRIGDRQYVHVAGATLIAAMFGHHVLASAVRPPRDGVDPRGRQGASAVLWSRIHHARRQRRHSHP